MVQLRTSPSTHSVLTLEARKSCSFGLNVVSESGVGRDLTDATSLSLPVAPRVRSASAEPILNIAATGLTADGWASFALQASQLNLAVGSYDFTITMISQGYSIVLLKGTLELVENTERASTSSIYTMPTSTTALKAVLRGATVVKVVLSDIPQPVAGGGGGGTPLSDAGVAALVADTGSLTHGAVVGVAQAVADAIVIPDVTDAAITDLFNAPGSPLKAAILSLIQSEIAAISIPAPPTAQDIAYLYAQASSPLKDAVTADIDAAIDAQPEYVEPKDVYAFRRRTSGGTGAWEPTNRGTYKGVVWLGTDPSSSDQAAQDVRLIPED